MSKPQRRRIYNPTNSPFASPKAVVQQHMKNETDINAIVAKAKRGIAPLTRDGAKFVDLSTTPEDLTEAFARVEQSWELFESLPARAREELQNDPRNLFKANQEFYERHGLLKPQKQSPETSQGSPGGAGEGSPDTPSKKASKALKAPKPDPEDQE